MRVDVALVAVELLGVAAGPVGFALVGAELVGFALVDAAELVGAAELVVVEVFGCAVDGRWDVTGALRAGVVRRFVVCANDAGASTTTNKLSGSTKEIRGNGLTERFIRELIVLNAPRAF